MKHVAQENQEIWTHTHMHTDIKFSSVPVKTTDTHQWQTFANQLNQCSRNNKNVYFSKRIYSLTSITHTCTCRATYCFKKSLDFDGQFKENNNKINKLIEWYSDWLFSVTWKKQFKLVHLYICTLKNDQLWTSIATFHFFQIVNGIIWKEWQKELH